MNLSVTTPLNVILLFATSLIKSDVNSPTWPGMIGALIVIVFDLNKLSSPFALQVTVIFVSTLTVPISFKTLFSILTKSSWDTDQV